jgi:hypothetical protein
MCSVQGTGVQATSGWYRAGYILLFIVYVQSSVLCTVYCAAGGCDRGYRSSVCVGLSLTSCCSFCSHFWC